MKALPKNLSFVDIETTGTSPLYDRVIEIGILRVENGRLVRKYNQLINPERSIPPFITQMTGIDPTALEKASTFYHVRDEIESLLSDSVFVAHNVRFDYGFLRAEFQRQGKTFKSPHFCTVKLFRKLFPGKRHYNLDSLIEQFQFEVKRRHRAFDDAEVLWRFYKESKKSFPKKTFYSAIENVLQRPSLPSALDSNLIENLPESSGVYIFKDSQGTPLYIGKSVNIKKRVLSHFSADLASFELKIKQQMTDIEFRQTAGEMGALLLESELIKTLQPVYNRMLRNRHHILICRETVDDGGYKTVTWERVRQLTSDDIPTCLGVYKSERQLKDTLRQLAKEKDLCPKRLGIEHCTGVCFNYHLGHCSGACAGKEKPIRYNLRFVQIFAEYKFKRWPFAGPVIVQEKSLDKKSGFILDKWCLIGKAAWDEWDSININPYDGTFDVDVYKILVRFLLKPHKGGFTVQPLKLPQESAAEESLFDYSLPA